MLTTAHLQGSPRLTEGSLAACADHKADMSRCYICVYCYKYKLRSVMIISIELTSGCFLEVIQLQGGCRSDALKVCMPLHGHCPSLAFAQYLHDRHSPGPGRASQGSCLPVVAAALMTWTLHVAAMSALWLPAKSRPSAQGAQPALVLTLPDPLHAANLDAPAPSPLLLPRPVPPRQPPFLALQGIQRASQPQGADLHAVETAGNSNIACNSCRTSTCWLLTCAKHHNASGGKGCD
jgi:hypothetical protein